MTHYLLQVPLHPFNTLSYLPQILVSRCLPVLNKGGSPRFSRLPSLLRLRNFLHIAQLCTLPGDEAAAALLTQTPLAPPSPVRSLHAKHICLGTLLARRWMQLHRETLGNHRNVSTKNNKMTIKKDLPSLRRSLPAPTPRHLLPPPSPRWQRPSSCRP